MASNIFQITYHHFEHGTQFEQNNAQTTHKHAYSFIFSEILSLQMQQNKLKFDLIKKTNLSRKQIYRIFRLK